MPQFDKLTFLSQLFWVFIFFLTLYFIVLRYALPACSTSLKVRKKTVAALAREASAHKEEGASIFAGSEKVLCESVAHVRAELARVHSTGASWSATVARGINEKDLREAHKEWVQKTAEMVGKAWLAKQACSRKAA